MKIAIIGGGLAGTACAYVLKQAGAEPVIYEAGAELASGASGNALGLYAPRISAHRMPESDFYTSGYFSALRGFQDLEGIDWNLCGSLYLITDERKEKQFKQTIENWSWPAAHMQLLDAREASNIAGVELQCGALYLPDSGTVSPRKLCHSYAQGVEIHLNTKIDSLKDIEADAVILAGGTGVKEFEEVRTLPLQKVRGQVTQTKSTDISEQLKCNLCYGGYCMPAMNGTHIIGATFQRGSDDCEVQSADDTENIEKLEKAVPGITEGFEVRGSRASVRVSTKDYFPVIGRVHDCKDLYISAGYGSHGIVGSIAGADLLADMILGRPHSLPKTVSDKLNPVRFVP